MKLFNIDWHLFLRFMPLWETLPLAARHTFSKLQINQSVKADLFGDQLHPLIDAKVLTLTPDGKKAKLHENGQPLARVIRSMCRHDILGCCHDQTLNDYLSEHFTNDEKIGLSPDSENYYRSDNPTLIRHATSRAWIESALKINSLKDAQDWERQHKPTQKNHYGDRPLKSRFHDVPVLLNEKTVAAAMKVLRQFVEWRQPMPFADLPQRFNGMSSSHLSTAIHFGLRYLLLYATMHRDNMTPALTLWPMTAMRLGLPKAKPPAPIDPPAEVFHNAFLMDDMTTFLVAASAEPLRVRGNGWDLFAKASQQIEAALTSLPPWLTRDPQGRDQGGVIGAWNQDGQPIAYGYMASSRPALAQAELTQKGFIDTVGQPGKDLRIQPTQAGQAWLAGSSRDRLKPLLDVLRPKPVGEKKKAKRKKKRAIHRGDLGQFGLNPNNPEAFYGIESWDGHNDEINLLSGVLTWRVRSKQPLDIQAAIIESLRTLRPGCFTATTPFVRYHATVKNPLVDLQQRDPRMEISQNWSRIRPTVEELESFWGSLLMDFIFVQLVPLGAAIIGRGQDNTACIAMTDVGRYLLGLADRFKYGHDQGNTVNVVIQPNFDIVFLSASPQAEATLARFCQRVGQAMGTLFKITKKSIFTAAGTGMDAEQVLDTLRSVATKGVPENVEHEIRHWFGACKQVCAQPIVVVRCPDPETARRVLAVGGKKVHPLTDTLVELPGSKIDATLSRKLKDAGIFIHPTATAISSSTKGGRRASAKRGSFRLG